MDTKYWKEIGLGGLLCGSLVTVIVMYFFFTNPKLKWQKSSQPTLTRVRLLCGAADIGAPSGATEIKKSKLIGPLICVIRRTRSNATLF